MTDPIGSSVRFRFELDGGEVVESDGAAVVLTLPAPRAHDLAHVLGASALPDGPRPKREAEADRLLARVLEDGAAALGDEDALTCSARLAGPVPVDRRLAAAELLAELSAAQRIAVVDAAAGWLGRDAGAELAYALLTAVSASDAAARRVYLALLGQ